MGNSGQDKSALTWILDVIRHVMITLGNSNTGTLYGATLDLYMKDAPFDYHAVARKHINEALGRNDP